MKGIKARVRRAAYGATAVACMCVSAATTVPASAHQFTASAYKKTPPLKIRGSGSAQVFKFGQIEVECSVAKAKGAIAESPTPLLKVEVAYKECESPTKIFGQATSPKVHFKSKVEYLYHSNGYVELGADGEPESVEVGPGTVELGIQHTGGCKVLWPKQTVPLKAEKKPGEEYSSALFANEEVAAANLTKFPTGFQRRLTVANAFRGMEFGIEETGLCEDFEKTESKQGKYTGELQLEVPGGDLAFE